VADASSPFAPSIDAIDRVVHDPTRFRILGCLYVVESADFLFLMRQLGLTKGNLSSHMTRLEVAGYVSVEKGTENNRPKTFLRLAPAGRRAVEQYAGRMQQLLDELRHPRMQPEAKRHSRGAALKPRLT
jgi:DNA-binding MarR family transcriptional regulator